ncbi:Alpha-L-arabinofuranosidase 1, partial [Bienertia sinuspersici]
MAISRIWLMIALIMLMCHASIAHKQHHHHHHKVHHKHHFNSSFSVNVSKGREIPPHFFGIFFEEINHAGAGGLWAELVSNRGFEAGGRHSPSIINPWGAIGDVDVISIKTELSSYFETNPVALRLDNIEEGNSYKVVFYVKSTGPLEADLSFASEDGTQVLAFKHLSVEADKVKNWTKIETTLQAKGSYKNSRLQFTTRQEGTIWLDQVSAIPNNTYKGHGFRLDLMKMLLRLKPKFLRFPGGCYVEGSYVRNGFRWKETVGPWEKRPGHFGDLAEDLGAEPVWVAHSGLGLQEQIDSYLVAPFLGHPTPFNLKYIAVGNEACQIKGFDGYTDIYLRFYKALRKNYPDIRIISNCDASQKPLDHPADLYDYHNYTSAEGMLELTKRFKDVRRDIPHAPKAFVSEYAVTQPSDKVGNGTFKSALAEAAFLLSLEENRHNVLYGIASYWVQTFFKQSSGATLLNVHFHNHSKPENTYVTAISWNNEQDKTDYITIKVVNFNNVTSNLKISIDGIDNGSIKLWKKTVLASDDLDAENTFDNPIKVVPITTQIESEEGKDDIEVEVQPYSFTAFDLINHSSNKS